MRVPLWPIDMNVATLSTKSEYIPISIATLIPQQMIGVRLYTRGESDGRAHLYKSETVVFRESDRIRLLEHGNRYLYIRKCDHARYQEYLREHIDDFIVDEKRPIVDRIAAFGEIVRDVLATTFQSNKTEAIVSGSIGIAERCVSLLSRDDVVASDLMGVLHHDYHTFTHSANVSFFSVLLAKGFGIRDEASLREIAIGGMIHDIGKLDISDQILTKPGKLTDLEYDTIKEHPRAGFLKLKDRDDISFGQLMMTYQHHERLDGKGYPVGCEDDDIHPWAKICTVVDVYEAMTANRPYRPPIRKHQVKEIMLRDANKAFDAELLQCWWMKMDSI